MEFLSLGVLIVVVGLWLLWASARKRVTVGLGSGNTVALDDLMLYSERLKLVGRPDRIERVGEWYIPEEWKSSKRVNHGHRLQLATYFLLIEDAYGVRPPHGFVVLVDGRRVKVQNTPELRVEVLHIAERIREHREKLMEEIPVRHPAAKCRACSQRGNCKQASSRKETSA